MKKAFVIVFLLSLLSLPACGPGVSSPPTSDATAAFQTEVANIVVSTEAAQRHAAALTASEVGMETEIARRVAITLTAMATSTPEFTFTPSFTPSPSPSITSTFTLTPNYPRVTAGANTNCRSGPGVAYEILGMFRAGETAEIVGQDIGWGYWVIRLPSEPAILCWIWRNSATVTGEANPVPFFTPQPTPTMAIDFLLAYAGFTSCGGLYQLKFKIVNNSELTWESNQVAVTDRTTGVETIINRDHFPNYVGCSLTADDTNLAPGEVGYTTSDNFAADPTDHNFRATIQVCSAEGQGGTCIAKTIIFIP